MLERLGDVEVVGERLEDGALRCLVGPGAAGRAVQLLELGDRRGQALVGVVPRLVVAAVEQQQADGGRAGALDQVGDEDQVAGRLGHLLALGLARCRRASRPARTGARRSRPRPGRTRRRGAGTSGRRRRRAGRGSGRRSTAPSRCTRRASRGGPVPTGSARPARPGRWPARPPGRTGAACPGRRAGRCCRAAAAQRRVSSKSGAGRHRQAVQEDAAARFVGVAVVEQRLRQVDHRRDEACARAARAAARAPTARPCPGRSGTAVPRRTGRTARPPSTRPRTARRRRR